uniref:Cytochrome b n=1 Tax=Pseudogarypus banksi TaxID=1131925 RepID=H9MFI9_9ARAC|nr:cytochrome b [Pseudogarypus banksi]
MKSYSLINIKPLLDNFMIMPTPLNISFWWTNGSTLGILIIMQTITGLMLSSEYSSCTSTSFFSILSIMKNSSYGWVTRFSHSNGASIFMFLIYSHIMRSIYYNNNKNKLTYMTGMIIFIMTMISVFLGYVLPWGQMSFWGATVITSLTTVIPFTGKTMASWLWGTYTVGSYTLKHFFMLHFILPLLIIMMIMIHINILHLKGSKNSMLIIYNLEKLSFSPLMIFKDMPPFFILITILMAMNMFNPYLVMDPQNFIEANPMLTPTHIKPEWYFLFSYAILRSIANKIGGVLALIFSILIFMVPMMNPPSSPMNYNYSLKLLIYWAIIVNLVILTNLGGSVISDPLTTISQYMGISWFLLFFLYYP